MAARLRDCVRSYWDVRGSQSQRQREGGGIIDAGTRSEATGGKHLDALLSFVVDVIRAAGYRDSEIRIRSDVGLPGYYRPLKKWDLIVVRDGRLCAAMELKSQVGSFGNNFNNRAEEAIGSSTDFWTAYREGALGTQQPWIGYFLLVESTTRSTTPVRLANAVFEPMSIFRNTSYMDRYAILCRRLVLERNYTAAALVASPRGTTGEYSEPAPDLGVVTFVRSLYGHLIGAA